MEDGALRKAPEDAARVKPFLLALAASLLTGCVERRLLVDSEPTGARIWVNGTDKGTTPATIPYVRPGHFDVRLEKSGYRSVVEEVETPTTVDAVPGPDFFAENGPWRVYRQVSVLLHMDPLPTERLTKEKQRDLLRRAEAFRAEADTAAKEEGTPVPTVPHETKAPAPAPAPAKTPAPAPSPPPPPPPPAPAPAPTAR